MSMYSRLRYSYRRTRASVGKFASMGQTVDGLGYFGPFMQAWGKASEQVRAQVYALTQEYERGKLSADAEVRDVSTALGIAIPPGW